MVDSRDSPGILRLFKVGVATLAVGALLSCSSGDPPTPPSSAIGTEIRYENIDDVRNALQDLQQTQQHLIETQQTIDIVREEAEQVRRQSAFLKGACVSLAVAALILGTSLGSSARTASKTKGR